MSYPTIRVLEGRDRRLRAGHPWLFSNEIRFDEKTKALEPGTLVRVMVPGGRIFGVAQFNPHSLIAARMLTRNKDAVIDAAFFRLRIERALRLRRRMFAEPYYRLLHAESDGLPGVVVDRYGDILVVQINTVGMERFTDVLLATLERLLEPRAMLLRNDSAIRALEGLEREVRVVAGEIPARVRLVENDLPFEVDLAGGQKTGWYFDQRLNRRFVRLLARDQEVLDLYCYGGGFGLNALAGGAASVLAVDSSAAALEIARANAALQGVADRFATERSEVFAMLDRLSREKRRFGLVLADPPAFVRNRKSLAVGLRAYRKLARLCASVTGEGGCLAISSCSHNVTEEAFAREVVAGIRAAGRGAIQLQAAGAGPDHPLHPALPETAYLKFRVYALD